MQLGMIGLGRMGGSMVERLLRGGHQCVVFDSSPESVASAAEKGALGTSSLPQFIAKLQAASHLGDGAGSCGRWRDQRHDPASATGLDGDHTLFGSFEGIQSAWRIVQPILEAKVPLHPYDRGSWGQGEADRFTALREHPPTAR